MAGNPFFSGRIPKELNERVVKHCEETGKTKTQVLVEALSGYLNIPIPESNPNLRSEVTKEQFASLESRVTSLEALLTKDIVITQDINDNSPEKTNAFSSDNMCETNDNTITISQEAKIDNKSENTDNVIAGSAKVNCDNINENADNDKNTTLSIYQNIDTKRLSELTDLKRDEKANLRRQAFKKAEKEGYEITKEVKFNPPIEANLRRGIMIGETEYKLLCEGTDEKEKPIWSLIPYDNISYQPDILNITN